ncbi:MAG: Ig-like domain-containing protein [bacterium]
MKSTIKGYHLILIAVITAILTLAPRAWAEWEQFDPNRTENFPSSRIVSLAADPNRVWVATDEGLVDMLLEDPNEEWTDHSLIDSSYTPITAMNIDQDALLWLGTPLGLVSYDPDNLLDPNNPRVYTEINLFDPNEIVDIEADANYVWIARTANLDDNDGLHSFNKSTHNFTLYRHDTSLFDSISCRGVASADDDDVWALPLLFGVYRYTVSGNTWDYFLPSGWSTLVFDSIEMGNANDLWLGSGNSGLWRFQPDPNVWAHWAASEYGLPSDSIMALGVYDDANRVIVVTNEGIARYDLDLDLWQPIGPPADVDLEDQVITHVLVDTVDSSNHQVWFGTQNGGLYRWKEGALIWTSPANGSVEVSLDTNSIEVVFNERIDDSTIDLGGAGSSLTFEMLDENLVLINDPNIYDPNDFTWHFRDPNNNTHLIIEPKEAGYQLHPNTYYRFKFTSAILDQSASPILNVDKELQFKTLVPPEVTDTDPNNNETGVALDATITITFNKLMDHASFFLGYPSNTRLQRFVDPVQYPVHNIYGDEASFVDANNQSILTIDVTGGFFPGSEYTLRIIKDVTDLSGNPLSEDLVLTFTTVPAPEVTSLEPADGAENVSWDTNIVVSFSESMDTGSVQDHFSISPGVTTGTFAWFDANTRVSFQPSAPLDYATTYQVTIDANAVDENGIPLGADYTWSFTTLADPDDVSVVSAFPDPNETAASIYTEVRVLFTQAMNTASVEGAFSLLDESLASVPGAFTWSADSKEFHFAPTNPLEDGGTYTAAVTTAARSVSLGHLDPNVEWAFTCVLPTAYPVDPNQAWPAVAIDPNGITIDPNDIGFSAMGISPADGSLWTGLASIDPNTGIWTGLGLYHYDGIEWTHYTASDPNCGLTSDAVTDIAFDSMGNVWVATEPDPNNTGGGIARFDGEEWSLYSPGIDPNQFYIVNRAGLTPEAIQLFFRVNAVDVYPAGTGDLIWIATTGGIGVGQYDPNIGADGDWKWTAKADPQTLHVLAVDPVTGTIWLESGNPIWDPDDPCNYIAGIDALKFADYLDEWPEVWDPNIWAWNPNGGLPKVRMLGQVRPFLRGMTADGNRNLWLAAYDGLYAINIDNLLLGVCDFAAYDYTDTAGGLLYDSIYGVTVSPDDPNTLWVITSADPNQGAGISSYDVTAPVGSPESWARYTFEGDDVFAAYPIKNGGVMAGTGEGLLIVGDDGSPSVATSYPSDPNTNIPVGGPYWVQFSELMDTDTAEDAFSLRDVHSIAVTGSFAWESARLVFTPSSSLVSSSVYTMRVDPNAADLSGNLLGQAYQVSFRTSSGWIASTSPYQGEHGVGIAAQVVINFDRAMDPNSVQNAFCLKIDPSYGAHSCIDGSFTWDQNNTVLTFNPDEDLDQGTLYLMTIDDTATDDGGTPLPEMFTLQFTTAFATRVLRFSEVECFIQSVEEKDAGIVERMRNLFRFIVTRATGSEP